MTKGLVYYTDLSPALSILHAVQRRLRVAAPHFEIVCVTNQGRIIDFYGDGEDDEDFQLRPVGYLVLPDQRGYLSMFRQMLAGLEALEADVAFLVEHDVLYAAEHFQFTPPRKDTYYYNQNVWKVRASDGHALHYPCSQTSGLCADRQLLLQHYRRRVELVETHGFTRAMGFEPGTHNRPERVDDYKAETWMSAVPNIDIRHDTNLTASRWTREEFRDKRFTIGWTESDRVPGWGVTEGRFSEFLDALRREVVV